MCSQSTPRPSIASLETAFGSENGLSSGSRSGSAAGASPSSDSVSAIAASASPGAGSQDSSGPAGTSEARSTVSAVS